MRVDRVELRGLFVHEQTTLELPERGVVVVTGENGSGKSSLVEAVAVACWGKTLRGAPAWAEGRKAAARVVAGPLDVRRTKTAKGSPKLAWSVDGEERQFGSTTKAQEALEGVVGSFEQWRRTHVFSASDAAHFTQATDKARKELIESLLGTRDKFTGALELARAEKRSLVKRQEGCGYERDGYERQAASEEKRLDEARALQAESPAPADSPPVDQAALRRRCEEVQEAMTELEQTLARSDELARGWTEKKASCAAELGEQRRRLDRLDDDECPTCGQPILDSLRAALRDEIEKLEEVAEELAAEADDKLVWLGREREKARGSRDELRQELRELERGLARAEVAARSAEAEARKRKRLDGIISDSTRALRRLRVELDGVEDESALVERELAVVGSAERVLGLRGVRALILGRALEAIELASTAWLERLSGRALRLRLSATRELKRGGTVDEVGLEVEGAGGGLGYWAASGGERRRIDLALLFALGEVAARGSALGTLFLDEIMDGLDEDGRAAACGVIQELGEERCVVVITHSGQIATSLRPVASYRVQGGKLR